MAITIGGFNIGEDFSLTIRDDQGNSIPWFLLGHGMEFDCNADDIDLKIVPCTNGGRPIYERIPSGWTGRIMFTRFNGQITSLFTALDANFYNLGRRPTFSMSAQVINLDGTSDNYSWTGVKLFRPHFGNWRANKEVDQTISFHASELASTSGILPLIGAL